MARLHHRRQATERDHCADSGRLSLGSRERQTLTVPSLPFFPPFHLCPSFFSAFSPFFTFLSFFLLFSSFFLFFFSFFPLSHPFSLPPFSSLSPPLSPPPSQLSPLFSPFFPPSLHLFSPFLRPVSSLVPPFSLPLFSSLFVPSPYLFCSPPSFVRFLFPLPLFLPLLVDKQRLVRDHENQVAAARREQRGAKLPRRVGARETKRLSGRKPLQNLTRLVQS